MTDSGQACVNTISYLFPFSITWLGLTRGKVSKVDCDGIFKFLYTFNLVLSYIFPRRSLFRLHFWWDSSKACAQVTLGLS